MKKYFALCLVLALALLISSCEVAEHRATGPPESENQAHWEECIKSSLEDCTEGVNLNSPLQVPEGQILGGSIEEPSVFDHLIERARSGASSMDESDVTWFAERLWRDVGVDIAVEKASGFEVLEGKSFVCVFGADTIYFLDDAEPPPEEESFEECVDNCIRACMEGVDPKDPNYQIEWKLCNRECRIICRHKNPKGRFSRRPSW